MIHASLVVAVVGTGGRRGQRGGGWGVGGGRALSLMRRGEGVKWREGKGRERWRW